MIIIWYEKLSINQIDSHAEEFHNNISTTCSLLGDAQESLKMVYKFN